MSGARSRRQLVDDAETKKRATLRKSRKERAKVRLGFDEFMDRQLAQIKRKLTLSGKRLKQEYLRCAHEQIDTVGVAGGHIGPKLPSLDMIERNEDNR